MPCDAASDNPAAWRLLETTCVMVPPSARCSIAPSSAPRFEPRPEINTVMRGKAMAAGLLPPSDDDRGSLARSLRDDAADAVRVLAGALKEAHRTIGVRRRNDERHADAAVEDAMHLG